MNILGKVTGDTMETAKFEKAKHCLMCGTKHIKQCPVSAFVYFECRECGNLINMPSDVMTFGGGLNGTYCGCNKPAEDVWESISYDLYRKKEENQCDGCKQGLVIKNGIHFDKNNKPFMACSKNKYEDKLLAE